MRRFTRQLILMGFVLAGLWGGIIPAGWAGTYSGGDGTVGDPYRINTTADWLELIATTGDWNTGKYFVLTSDLDFEGASIVPIAPDTSSDGGYQGTPFNGILDGAGHVIRNATIDQTGTDFVGLIGYLTTGGEIKNLGVCRNTRIESRYSGCFAL